MLAEGCVGTLERRGLFETGRMLMVIVDTNKLGTTTTQQAFGELKIAVTEIHNKDKGERENGAMPEERGREEEAAVCYCSDGP